MTKKTTIPKNEIRELPDQTTIEIREEEDGKRTISGYAVKWEMKSHPLGFFTRFREQFKKGAFTESLNKEDQ
jgi:uncharacterized protein